MTFFDALSTHTLLLYALIAGIAASVVGGIMGSYVVVKRISFISGSIAHSIVGGIGFFLWLERTQGHIWASPLQGALIAGILSALLIGWVHIHKKQREDSVIAAVWSFGMAIGLLFISQTPGFTVELTNYLIGNILWVSKDDIILLLLLDAFVIVLVSFLYHKFHAICFDEHQARLQGIAVNTLYLLLLSLVAITTVLLMQIVGIILVMTMLTIPATIANLFTRRLRDMMLLSILLSIFFCVFGMFLSFHLDWPSGASIALVAVMSYIFMLCTAKSETN